MKVTVLVVGLGLAVLTAPGTPDAQPQQKVRRIGLLLSTTPVAASHVVAAFAEALLELGHAEGKNVIFEYRWAEGRVDRFPGLAADLVRLKVDVIVASSSPAADSARKATSTIPIVMVGVVDPVALGLVASLARPGSNVTGLSSQLTPEIRAKQLQLLKEAVPTVSRVAVLRNAAVATPATWQEYEAAGRAVGVRLQSVEVTGPEELGKALVAVSRERGAALWVPGDPMFWTLRQRIVELSAEHRLPGMFFFREFTDAGGLMSYSARLTDQFRRAAMYVDKILKGAKPADLPVEQPTKFELVVNLKTAKALGLTIPQSILIRADEVIQ